MTKKTKTPTKCCKPALPHTGLGLTSTIFGVVGFFIVPILFSLAAVICGAIALGRDQNGWWGVVLGTAGFLLWLILFLNGLLI